jgi:sulfate adenylyltransferase subunit 1 (EFTu-like GTPase family)
MTLNDGIKGFQKAIDSLVVKIDDPVFCAKLKKFTDADEETKNAIRKEAATDGMDLVVSILRTDLISPELKPDQVGRIFNAYVAWNNVVENVSLLGHRSPQIPANDAP